MNKIITLLLFITSLSYAKDYKKIEFAIELPESSKQIVSRNWSGYVAATYLKEPEQNSVQEVTGKWTVPLVYSPDNKDSSMAIWVGIDGFDNDYIEQVGTCHDWKDGKQVNYAWFDMYPSKPERIANFPVEIGDVIEGAVKCPHVGQFEIKIINHTKKVYVDIDASRTQSLMAPRRYAQWIVECPFIEQGYPFSKFTRVKFDECYAKINDVPGSIEHHFWEHKAIKMLNNNGQLKAVPSNLSESRSFTVEWKHE